MKLDFVEKLDFNSKFFELYKLSEGCYGAIARENSGMRSNAGFIDLGDFTLVIDTTISLGAAEDLKKAAIQYTKKEPRFVVITHFHLDHVIGNMIFDPSTLIITSDRTLQNIEKEDFKRIDEIKGTDQKEITNMEEALKKDLPEEKRVEFENNLKVIHDVQSKNFFLRLPNTVFKEKLILNGKERTVHLQTFKKAHTDGDVLVYIPEDKVLFAGDLLFARVDPWLGSGDPDGWISLIDDILALDFKVTVPGHGKLASKEEFSLEQRYIREIVDLAKNKINSGEESIQIKREEFSQELQAWKSPILEWNVNFLAEFLKKV
jgi:glyoxylase-like metal-dependent hydrolase (beta-lactamase superfamily II)